MVAATRPVLLLRSGGRDGKTKGHLQEKVFDAAATHNGITVVKSSPSPERLLKVGRRGEAEQRELFQLFLAVPAEGLKLEVALHQPTFHASHRQRHAGMCEHLCHELTQDKPRSKYIFSLVPQVETLVVARR